VSSGSRRPRERPCAAEITRSDEGRYPLATLLEVTRRWLGKHRCTERRWCDSALRWAAAAVESPRPGGRGPQGRGVSYARVVALELGTAGAITSSASPPTLVDSLRTRSRRGSRNGASIARAVRLIQQVRRASGAVHRECRAVADQRTSVGLKRAIASRIRINLE
jgi:hypothetical protein